MKNYKLTQLFFNSTVVKKLLFPFLGLFVGITIIPLVFQFNADVKTVLSGGDTDFQYLQISKEVGISTSLGFGSINFSEQEIKNLRSKPFIDDVVPVLGNSFRVYVKAPQGGFDGYMHAVPDEFVDDKPDNFNWEEGDTEIPVIISNQFYTLLNTGILPAQGQPAIPKVAIKQLSLPVYLGADEKRLKMRVRVVGFSDRITTVIVPQNFLNWANSYFSPEKEGESTMAILKVSDSGSESLKKYLAKNDYEVNKEQLIAQKGVWIAEIILIIVFILGSTIGLLSLNSLALLVKLIVMESKVKIETLLLLGYKQKEIIRSLLGYFGIRILLLFCIAAIGNFLVIEQLHRFIQIYSLTDLEISTVTFALIPILMLSILVYMSVSIRKVLRTFN